MEFMVGMMAGGHPEAFSRGWSDPQQGLGGADLRKNQNPCETWAQLKEKAAPARMLAQEGSQKNTQVKVALKSAKASQSR